MDPRFAPHNRHVDGLEIFLKYDPHLERLHAQPLIYRFPILDHLPDVPGIYAITGGRQVGKTTVLKQHMADLIASGTHPDSIAYFTGELIDDHHSLVRIVSDFIEADESKSRLCIILDEVTYCRDWDRGVKYLADAGLLNRTALILTGSDSVIIREARMRFPGRRGAEGQVDFHLFPLSFSEFTTLKNPSLAAAISPHDAPTPDTMQTLFEMFSAYLLHGGYLTAINDMERTGAITAAVFATYSDWIRGDVIKRNKQEQYLREVMAGVIKRYGSQLTWNSLASDLSIDHPATVADYLHLLVRMDAMIIHPALREDKLAAAPKKARKVLFADPFILHAVSAWLRPSSDPFTEQVIPRLTNTEWAGQLAEACAIAHYHRLYETYYIKSEGEVDIAYVKDGRFWPIEIKWSTQIRPKDIKQIAKYPNGIICTRSTQSGQLSGVPTEPLPLNLFRLGPSPCTQYPS